MDFIFSSIRTKLTLALLGVGLFSIITVGLISRGIMLDRFNDLVVEQASIGFVDEAREYYKTYGTWERARNSETFFDFTRRTRPLATQPLPRPNGEPPRNTTRPPEQNTAGGPPRRFGFGGQAPPFIVTDEFGIVELPLFAGYEIGDVVERELFDRAVPIIDNGSLIGMAVPEQRFAVSAIEARYLDVFESSILISLFLAGALALLLGWYFGRKFTLPILRLKWSMDAMRKGELHQEVEVESSDELGKLTDIFNIMSRDLSKAYRELEDSNRLLSGYSNWLVAESKKPAK